VHNLNNFEYVLDIKFIKNMDAVFTKKLDQVAQLPPRPNFQPHATPLHAHVSTPRPPAVSLGLGCCRYKHRGEDEG
jgi:hypothetical protein